MLCKEISTFRFSLHFALISESFSLLENLRIFDSFKPFVSFSSFCGYCNSSYFFAIYCSLWSMDSHHIILSEQARVLDKMKDFALGTPALPSLILVRRSAQFPGICISSSILKLSMNNIYHIYFI